MYRVIDVDGNVLIETGDAPDVIKYLYNDDGAWAVLKLGDDGEYHIDGTDW